MKASLMLDRNGSAGIFEVLPIRSSDTKETSILILHKVTETGSPFIVVAGYYLKQVKTHEGGILAEIETILESEYPRIKQNIREKLGESLSKTPITFW